ncbi:hypothetical protein MAP00_005023 [Monascus purpureus]|nr:hypothetical protein MAP00_005023 [Monascus purpureus]
MFRQLATKPLSTASRAAPSRCFSTAVPRLADGDTGAPRASGNVHGDQFTRREAAAESLYIREKELDKLRALKKKLAEQRKHLDELDRHIDELTKEQGGEKH